MNKTIFNVDMDRCDGRDFKLRDIVINRQSREETAHTAFIGKCGTGPKDSLYMICYGSIFLVENPYMLWSSGDCPIKVKEFVDLEIQAIQDD